MKLCNLLFIALMSSLLAAAPPVLEPPPPKNQDKPKSQEKLKPQETPKQASDRSQQVTFKGAGEVELKGTLLMPKTLSDEKVAAMLLLPGSGPTDRNGNQQRYLITDLLSQIAERLAYAGIATLRFDKRACPGYVSLWPKEAEAMNQFFSMENFITDVQAAYQFLQNQPQVDAARVGILGHSEGGLFAMMVAQKLADDEHPPAALILAATAGRPLDVVVREQIAFILDPQKMEAGVKADILQRLDEAIEQVKSDRTIPEDLPIALRALFNPGALDLIYGYFTIDPTELADSFRGPVLIVQGENDNQISATKDAPVLAESFKQREHGTSELLIVPEMSHNLKAAPTLRDKGIAGPVVPAAMDKIADWSRNALVENAKAE